ncbi:hypothetical protein [Hydrogenimonas sp.]
MKPIYLPLLSSLLLADTGTIKKFVDGDTLYFYSNGQGVRQSYSTAKEYYGKTYDMGDQPGCNAYAKLNKQGY